jgi:hypothetical protein
MLDQFDPAIHANNESNRSTRKLVESNYTLQVSYAITVITAERNFRSGIIAAIAEHHLDAAMALTPTGAAGTYATSSLALHGIPSKDIIPAILKLALANGRHLLKSVITDLSAPFVCTSADSADKFVFNFRKLSNVLSINQQALAAFQLKDFFIAAATANFQDLLRPYFAIAASAATPDLNAYITAFQNAKPEFQSWLELQAHAPSALAAVAAKSVTTPPPTAAASSDKRPLYCWAHGHGYHSSDECNIKDTIAGFHKDATKHNRKGGSTRIANFRPNWKPK